MELGATVPMPSRQLPEAEMSAAIAVQCLIAGIWSVGIATEAPWFAWPWFPVWLVGLSAVGYLACMRAARQQPAMLRRVMLGVVAPAVFVAVILTSSVAEGADVTIPGLIFGLVTANLPFLPSWLGCLIPPSPARTWRGARSR